MIRALAAGQTLEGVAAREDLSLRLARERIDSFDIGTGRGLAG